MIFKDFWTKKSHDIPIQHELDEVKDDVHELDERVDQYEDAKGNLKPGVHVDKNTVHVTYDRNGVPVSSYVDDEGIDKGAFPQFQVSKPGPSIHTDKWDKCVEDVKRRGGANAYAVCTAQLGESAFKSEIRHMGYVKTLIMKARKEVKKMGIGDAGGVPHSLLARQDLEGDAELEKSDKLNDSSIYELNNRAKEADTSAEKKEIADKIREGQERQQQEEIDERRGKMSKNADAEQNWILLKQKRRELQDKIASLTDKKNKHDGESEGMKQELVQLKQELEKVNEDISYNLDALK